MGKLDTLMELNRLEKENRRNRLDDKPIKQESYDEMEEFFDPLTKTVKINNEKILALGKQKIKRIKWANLRVR